MVMQTMQVRMEQKMVKKMDVLIQTGLYANKGELIRDAVRKLVVDMLIGIAPSDKDSVKEIRALRKRLSE